MTMTNNNSGGGSGVAIKSFGDVPLAKEMTENNVDYGSPQLCEFVRSHGGYNAGEKARFSGRVLRNMIKAKAVTVIENTFPTKKEVLVLEIGNKMSEAEAYIADMVSCKKRLKQLGHSLHDCKEHCDNLCLRLESLEEEEAAKAESELESEEKTEGELEAEAEAERKAEAEEAQKLADKELKEAVKAQKDALKAVDKATKAHEKAVTEASQADEAQRVADEKIAAVKGDKKKVEKAKLKAGEASKVKEEAGNKAAEANDVKEKAEVILRDASTLVANKLLLVEGK